MSIVHTRKFNAAMRRGKGAPSKSRCRCLPKGCLWRPLCKRLHICCVGAKIGQ
jgi:hypothetical protein